MIFENYKLNYVTLNIMMLISNRMHIFFVRFVSQPISLLLFYRLQTGNSSEFLKIYRYLFIDYNLLFAKNLLDKYNCNFAGKNDQNFIDTMYKVIAHR